MMSSTDRIVVVGAGMTGVVTAVLLARKGREVVLVEQRPQAGGELTLGGLDDAAPQPWDGQDDQSGLPGFLNALHVDEPPRWHPLSTAYGLGHAGDIVRVPSDPEGYIQAHVDAFGLSRQGLEEWVTTLQAIRREAATCPLPWSWWRRRQHRHQCPVIWEWGHQSIDQLARACLGATDAVEVLTRPAMWQGCAPQDMNVLAFSEALGRRWEGGLVRPDGGAAVVIRTLIQALESMGGRVMLGQTVRQIHCEGRSVVGVELADDEEMEARCVVLTTSSDECTRLMGRRVVRERPGLHYMDRHLHVGVWERADPLTREMKPGVDVLWPSPEPGEDVAWSMAAPVRHGATEPSHLICRWWSSDESKQAPPLSGLGEGCWAAVHHGAMVERRLMVSGVVKPPPALGQYAGLYVTHEARGQATPGMRFNVAVRCAQAVLQNDVLWVRRSTQTDFGLR